MRIRMNGNMTLEAAPNGLDTKGNSARLIEDYGQRAEAAL